ncbi:hypothetical protein GCM10010260_59350 [Streptomyces filipinensis]|uniref:Uncharacterized protein n=1 Tax=Streptomyces filipinensis TaxID=66887 RepID=A0A918MD20_9ACTN|nr:hypothetical protein GCM10010260_59350 [Streptomyces filipinensis]
MLEPVYRDAGTGRLLPRLLKVRTCGTVFVTHCRWGPGRVVARNGLGPARVPPLFKPSPEAIAELTSLLAPGGNRS